MNNIIFGFCLILLSTVLQCDSSEFCAECAKDTLQNQYGEIIYAGLIFRHGNRVPEKSYPTDPHLNYSWPFEFGQLVNEGKQRAYNLGRFFRPRYTHLTGGKYTPSQVITHGSSYDRTLMSGILFNAGFFPPSSTEVWHPELLWQPVPIHSAPAAIDNVLRLEKVDCPNWTRLKNEFYQHGKIIEDLCNKYKDEIDHIEKHSGLTIKPCRSAENFRNLIIVQDTLLVEDEHKLPLPEWTKKVYPEPLNTFRDQMYVEVEDNAIKRLIVGPFLSVLASDLINVAGLKNYTIPKTIFTSEPSKTPRLHLFAGHDINVIIIMRALGVYPNKAPHYSAAVGFELRRKSNEYYVTVIYENSLNEPPKVMNIPHCNGVCTLPKFLSLLTPLMPENFKKECHAHDNNNSRNTGKSGHKAGIHERYSNRQRVIHNILRKIG